ncbi:hypothetical protein LCGC14_1126400 [marine sediment metagenome]|uniref:Uncharacterized protein n=1 Tax=marine sediment metagenome TaxID=412755 RepID=A0A0F9MQE3_9ZZZZ
MSRDLTDHVREKDESEGPPMTEQGCHIIGGGCHCRCVRGQDCDVRHRIQKTADYCFGCDTILFDGSDWRRVES